tara:strand:+ start:966 stop:1244 length:279 start_codon:yes stop_codon:yes gene_type:complete
MKTDVIILIAISLVSFGLSSCETTNSGGAGEELAAAAVKPYPLDVCLVTSEPIHSKGTPIRLVHEGQEIMLCCPACKMAFKANPSDYLAKLP